MQPQIPHDSPPEMVSQNPELSNPISPEDQDFLNQNLIINQEMMKYDQLLKTWPMFIYKVWTVLFFAILFSVAFYLNFSALYPLFKEMEFIAVLIYLPFLLFLDLLLGIPIYSCILIWIGLYKRDIYKLEWSMSISKCFAILGVFSSIYGIILYVASGEFILSLALFSPLLAALANILPAIYIKRVLKERNIFQSVSSYAA